ncbi:MAG: hypothetical protein RLP12_02795, partial [Ekhidna sp.]
MRRVAIIDFRLNISLDASGASKDRLAQFFFRQGFLACLLFLLNRFSIGWISPKTFGSILLFILMLKSLSFYSHPIALCIFSKVSSAQIPNSAGSL